MQTQVDIAIVGAGAAGLAAGIFAAQATPNLKIVLLDGARTVGAKILVSGGGRCNVTHTRVTPQDFHGPKRLIDRILKRFDENAVAKWFESLGVPLKTEPTGKLFPTTNTARTVLEAILNRCDQLGVTLLTEHRVSDLKPTPDGFDIIHQSGRITAKKVVMATGGRSLPKTGSDGQGWSIAQRLGHTVTPTHPALVPLVLADTFFHSKLSGISHEAALTTRVQGKVTDRRTGSLLWTHFGISGPVVLDASRFWVIANAQGQDASLEVSFLPDLSFEDADRWLSPTDNTAKQKTVAATLSTRLPARVVQAICTHAQQTQTDLCGFEKASNRPPRAAPVRKRSLLDPTPTTNVSDSVLAATPLNHLPRDHRRALTRSLTELPLPVTRPRGWNYAEVTAGGVPLEEINPRTMASRKAPGLYLIGEILNCDARIGGFNFQWAWTTAFIAAQNT